MKLSSVWMIVKQVQCNAWTQAELEQLRQKLEKTEKERQELKLSVDRLETKVCQLLLFSTFV